MSTTLQDTGMFASRKRRTEENVSSSKHHGKRALTSEKMSRSAGINSTMSSSASSGKVAGAIAPKSRGNTHVQEAIHKEVQYKRQGQGKVSPNTMAVFRFVNKAFIIPSEFEKDHKFGPLSGVSHELRVVSAFMAGQLEAYSKDDAQVKMCLECGKKGHFPRYCPSALDQ